MLIHFFLPLLGQLGRFSNRLVSSVVLAAPSVLLVACVSGGGGGGSSPSGPPPPRGLFSHASYNFVMLNSTRTGSGADAQTLDNRTLGLIDVEEAEVRALLPEGAVWDPDDVRYTRYTIVGGANDLTKAFFRLDHGNSARLLFQAAPRYAQRNFTLDYVVNTLGVKALRVEANISYIDRNGDRQTLISPLPVVPVTIRAVASVPNVDELLVFEGIRQEGTERRPMPETSTREESFDAGRLSETMNTNTTETKQLPAFTTTWQDADYAPDADEPTPAAPRALDQLRTGDAAADNVTQRLEVLVTLTLNNTGFTASRLYVIEAGTNLTTIDGNSGLAGSFLNFLSGFELPAGNRAVLDANDRVGPNVTAVAWEFTFPYTANVTRTTTADNVRVSRLAYTTEGAIDENAVGRTRVSRLTNVLRRLGIRVKEGADLPDGFKNDKEEDLPTLYYRLADANPRAMHCETALYVDNQDYGVKAQASMDAARPLLDYETAPDYDACTLQASVGGVIYHNITTTEITDRTNQTTAVSGRALGPTALGCGSMNATRRLEALRTDGCTYQANLNITVNDVNEPVLLGFVADVSAAARDEANVGLAGDRTPAVGNASMAALASRLTTLTYMEEDKYANGTALSVDVPRIAAVAPAALMLDGEQVATAPLFDLVVAGPGQAHLQLNATVAAQVLDYEALTANATGQRRFSVTIEATDNSRAALTTERVFNLEVRDVVYAPVDVTYMPADNVNHTDDPVTQTLLPGFAQFAANGGAVLGTLTARNPETNDTTDLAYGALSVVSMEEAQRMEDPVRQASLALSVDPANRAAAGAAATDSPVPVDLILVGLGLRAGDNFTLRLNVTHNKAPQRAFDDVAVPIVVSYAAVNETEDTGYAGQPPIAFARGQFLADVVEGNASAAVHAFGTTTAFNLSAPSNLVRQPAAALAPHFVLMSDVSALLRLASLRADVMAQLTERLGGGDLARLARDAAVFQLDTTGSLTLTRPLDFTAQNTYTLLVRVANTTGRGAADLLMSDYAAVQVVVEDTNSAPAIMALTAVDPAVSVDSTSVRLNDLPETTPAGTVLATLRVEDDNPLTGVNFKPTEGATAYRIELDPAPAQAPRLVAATTTKPAHYVASYRLVAVAPDYEANATLNVTHVLEDAGRFAFNVTQQRFLFDRSAKLSVSLRVEGVIDDVNEAPRLVLRDKDTDAVLVGEVPLNEDASVGTVVLRVYATDAEGLTAATNLTYRLSTAPSGLAAALNVTGFTDLDDANAQTAAWDLVVADEDALENAGDGQIFTLRLMATDAGGLTTTQDVALAVIDVPVFRVTAETVNTTLLRLREQEALDDPDRVLRSPLLRFVDVQPDIGETFFGTAVPLGEVNAEISALRYAPAVANGLEDEERFNLFTLTANDAAVDLVLGEAGLIEQNLLGADNVNVAVTLSDPAGGAASAATVEVPVEVIAPQPEGWRFADARNNARQVPAAYNFDYTQTNYADGGAPCMAGNQTHARIDELCYATVQVREDAEGVTLTSVARDRAAPQAFSIPDTVNPVDDNTFGILLTNVTSDLTENDITIYTLDAAGNLAAASNFATYFNYTLRNASEVDDAMELVIGQKMYQVLGADGNVNPNARYAALDTLQLDRADPRDELNYFVVAEDGENNASRRAIAQVNFDVQVPGLNEPAFVSNLTLGALNLLDGITISENGGGDSAAEQLFDFTMVVNTPQAHLNITVVNPDGAATNQSVNVTVDVVATRGDEGPSSGRMDLVAGTASGHHLIRLGANPASNGTLNLDRGQHNATRQDLIDFQLARNVYGAAYIRVRFDEHEADTTFEPHYAYFPIQVENDAPAYAVANLTIGDLSSPAMENALDDAILVNQQLNLTFDSDDLDEPRQLADIRVAAAIDRASSTQYMRDLMLEDDSSQVATLDEGFGYVNHTLAYAEHAHGNVSFTFTMNAMEPRGFGVSSTRYASDTVRLPATFEVRPENDALEVLRDVVAVDFRLERDFNNASATSTASAGTATAAVFFADVDLATGDGLPPAAQIRILPGAAQTLSEGTTIQLTEDNLDHATPVVNRVAGAPTRIRVEVPDIALTLTRTEYNAINAHGETITLNFTVNVPDSGAPSLRVNATARIRIAVNTNDAQVTENVYMNRQAVLAEGNRTGAAVFPTALNITDVDIQRPGGDTYTYDLTVRRSGQPDEINDLLRWSHGGSEMLSGRSSPSFQRRIELAKTADDADVGVYTVDWSIREDQGADERNRSVAAGRFTLTIVNVDDAPTVYCDARNATNNCGYQGARFDLQEIFGEQQRGNARINTAQDTGESVTVIFEDPDLLVPAGTFLPGAMNVSTANAALTVDGVAQGVVTIADGAALAPQDLGMGRINVTLPLRLTLTQAQYDAINAHADGGILSFDIVLRAGPVSAAAQAQALITARLNTALVTDQPGLKNNNLVATAEDAPPETNVGPALTIRDADRQRATGNTYRYTVEVRDKDDAPVAGLLEWDVSDLMGEYREATAGASSATFTRRLRLARSPQDADVAQSLYAVDWTITDANTSGEAQQVAGGAFRLNITNVNDPLTVVCDADNAGEDCGFTPARYLISALNPAGANNALIASAANVTVLFSDDDLLAGLAPDMTVGNFTDADPDDGVALDETNFQVAPSAIEVRRVGDTNRINVTFPVSLRLTQTQFDAINASGEAVSLRFNFTLANTGGSGVVAANGSIELQPDADGDGIVNANDNCPLFRSQDQSDDDDDGIGNVCEAEAVRGLMAVPDGPNAVNLTWTNPSASDLQLLNISYGPTNNQTNRATINITTEADLAAGAQVTYQITGLLGLTEYTFTVGGIDFRQGLRDQTLPEESVDATTPLDPIDEDGDGVADGEDNCIEDHNPDQMDSDNDTYGDACGPDRDNDGIRELQTAAQLSAMRSNNGENSNYELITDIDLSIYPNWSPFNFFGKLDGNNHTIANLSIDSTSSHVGLFAGGTGARIRNITLRIKGIRATGSRVGGLIGNANSGAMIRDAAVIIEGNISAEGTNAYVGGFLGGNGVSIFNSYVIVMGEISGTGTSDPDVGGLVGWHGNGRIENSYVLVLSGGSIKARNGGADAGGLVGYNQADAPSNSYAVINGTITATGGSSNNVGGLMGHGSATNSYFAGPVANAFGSSNSGSGLKRTLEQLKCPTVAAATCESATTYTNWNNTIWDFGDDQTLPDLRSRPRPPDLKDLLP